MSGPSAQPETLIEAPLRQTLFHIPPPAPFKNASSAYLKQESQTIWARNLRSILSDPVTGAFEPIARGSDTIVIHPGSRWIRVGRATDPYPVSIPHVIARKVAPNHPAAPALHRILKPDKMDTSSDGAAPPDEVVECIGTIRLALRSRMEFYKIPYEPEGSTEAATFNHAIKAEQIDEAQDVYRVDWVTGRQEDDIFIGHKVFRLAHPQNSGYEVRWPIYGNSFNTRYYSSQQAALNDLEIMWQTIIWQELSVDPKTFKDHSVILLIPDYFDKRCVSQLVNMLLVQLKFRRVCVQQEGYAACLGSGLTTACIVDIGAVKTSVSCVEDGLLLSDSRMLLDYGGDDITEFLHDLLLDVQFPYKEIDLSRLYDLHVMDDLKARLCTLSEADVGTRMYDFFVRRPGKPTEKYLLKAYDETIVAPMCIFEPKIIDFDEKKRVKPQLWDFDGVDDGDMGSDIPTAAMVISTQHLLQQPVPGVPLPSIDVKFEAGKLPLDVAIFNSVRATGNDKIKKFLQTVMVVGGTALVPGAIHALESRLQAIAFPLVPNIERLTVTTAPPDVDPRVLAWKGITILSRLEVMADMWITANEWEMLGMRCLRDRSLIDRPQAGSGI